MSGLKPLFHELEMNELRLSEITHEKETLMAKISQLKIDSEKANEIIKKINEELAGIDKKIPE